MFVRKAANGTEHLLEELQRHTGTYRASPQPTMTLLIVTPMHNEADNVSGLVSPFGRSDSGTSIG